MTVLSSETSVLTAGARLPRVNLLPPEIAEGQRLRKVQLGLGAALGCAVVLVGGLYVSASHSVTAAQSSLDSARTRTTDLNGQIRKYDSVTKTLNEAAAAQVRLTTAMGDEVRYSWLLKDLSLSVPSNVWLNTLTFSSKAPATGAGAATAAAASPVLATLTVTGSGMTHDDVALWLESLAGQQNAKGQKTYASPYFTNSNEVMVGNTKTVKFSSTADLTLTALSRRYLTAGS